MLDVLSPEKEFNDQNKKTKLSLFLKFSCF
jgi:hypothetical protein